MQGNIFRIQILMTWSNLSLRNSTTGTMEKQHLPPKISISFPDGIWRKNWWNWFSFQILVFLDSTKYDEIPQTQPPPEIFRWNSGDRTALAFSVFGGTVRRFVSFRWLVFRQTRFWKYYKYRCTDYFIFYTFFTWKKNDSPRRVCFWDDFFFYVRIGFFVQSLVQRYFISFYYFFGASDHRLLLLLACPSFR